MEKGRLLEDEARHFFQQIVSGVEYCHRNMVSCCSASELLPLLEHTVGTERSKLSHHTMHGSTPTLILTFTWMLHAQHTRGLADTRRWCTET